MNYTQLKDPEYVEQYLKGLETVVEKSDINYWKNKLNELYFLLSDNPLCFVAIPDEVIIEYDLLSYLESLKDPEGWFPNSDGEIITRSYKEDDMVKMKIEEIRKQIKRLEEELEKSKTGLEPQKSVLGQTIEIAENPERSVVSPPSIAEVLSEIFDMPEGVYEEPRYGFKIEFSREYGFRKRKRKINNKKNRIKRKF